ncbi:MAG: type II toxin-antitoxin system HipA family toxin [Gemmatimonadaceae bacterium]
MSRSIHSRRRRGDRLALVAFLNGIPVGQILQAAAGTLRFVYDDDWRTDSSAYPLSLSMPLTAVEHRHEAISAFLWGLLPDNHRTLEHYGRLFGVSAGSPVALLSHIGADCAGAVQFAPPETADTLRAAASSRRVVHWLDEEEIARELRTVRERGVPGTTSRTVGQFSLAGAQPKIALLEENGRWGRPSGRTPTNCILKPPSGEFRGFAENEHFCLEMARYLSLGVVTSRVARFGDEIAIIVDRFDRISRGRQYTRIHQEDICQALAVLPTRKYENEGGPGIADVISLLKDASRKAEDDVERFIRATVLNWVIAAPDAHAKNYALLHSPGGGVRLAPFYDILSFLPYADAALHRIKLAMQIGGRYLVRQVNRTSWETLAKDNGMSIPYVLDNITHVLDQLPLAAGAVADAAIHDGLDPSSITKIQDLIVARSRTCATALSTRGHHDDAD